MGERLEVAVAKIELAGVQQAPEQHYHMPGHPEHGKMYGREVLTTTPPGVYYLVDGKGRDAIQVMWVNTPEHGLGRISAHKLAEMLGWRVAQVPTPLPINPPNAPVTVMSAILEPVS